MVPHGEPTLAPPTSASMSTPVLELVEFRPAHFELLAGWFASPREVMQWGGNGVRHPLDAAQLQAIVDERAAVPPTRLSWMAGDGRSLVGHIELQLVPETATGRISRVAIAPQHRGRRLGRALVAAALQAAWQIEWIQRVDLRVYTFNAPALATYRALGFVTTHIDPEQPAPGGERWRPAVMVLERPAPPPREDDPDERPQAVRG